MIIVRLGCREMSIGPHGAMLELGEGTTHVVHMKKYRDRASRLFLILPKMMHPYRFSP